MGKEKKWKEWKKVKGKGKRKESGEKSLLCDMQAVSNASVLICSASIGNAVWDSKPAGESAELASAPCRVERRCNY